MIRLIVTGIRTSGVWYKEETTVCGRRKKR